MSKGGHEPVKASHLPEGDAIRILLEQHARVRALFADVREATGAHRQETFDELRALLAVHETAEEMVLRPTSAKVAGREVVDARNAEEAEATRMLKDLERLDVRSVEFDTLLAALEQAVLQHADSEEREEFPRVVAALDEEARTDLGKQILAAEAIAPTHPHPSTAGSTGAQWALGPFASIVDRTRDTLKGLLRS
ncbi:MAG TPA: hemerythrin domain-containing protein [Intrasporangium sp.]|uniref:hemerythrin domain-containing protein n=1 Tax=Intrasporangium sp. TaxID=1925024 RepID=UPI002D77D4B2|nr:hemerythrin domain-containing protein [Intrasporangium sp.]HET7399714.1 hemerythrin domain-containing protein [Intrasporangium sp.]